MAKLRSGREAAFVDKLSKRKHKASEKGINKSATVSGTMLKRDKTKARRSLNNEWKVDCVTDSNKQDVTFEISKDDLKLLEQESITFNDTSLLLDSDLQNTSITDSTNKSIKNVMSAKIDSSILSTMEAENTMFRRSKRLKHRVNFAENHTEIKSPILLNGTPTHFSTPTNNSFDANDTNKENINNLTYSNEKVMDYTYSPEKTSTDVIEMLRTPAPKKGTPYVKRLKRKSAGTTSTPFYSLKKTNALQSLVVSSTKDPMFKTSTSSKPIFNLKNDNNLFKSSLKPNIKLESSKITSTRKVPFTPKPVKKNIETATKNNRPSVFKFGSPNITSKKSINDTEVPSINDRQNVFKFGSYKKTPVTPKSLKKNFQTPAKNVTLTPGSTKMPDFASIHKKAFERMESLSEYKERKALRAEHLIKPYQFDFKKTPLENPELVKSIKKHTAPNSKMFTRFGYRIRENKSKLKEAVANKCPVKIKQADVQNKYRHVKGVRTNRRFDLLMEHRTKYFTENILH